MIRYTLGQPAILSADLPSTKTGMAVEQLRSIGQWNFSIQNFIQTVPPPSNANTNSNAGPEPKSSP
jgi:hypothetical protein